MLAESPNSVSFLRFMVLSMRPCEVHVYPQQVFHCGLPDSIPPDRKCFLLLDYLYFLLQCRKHLGRFPFVRTGWPDHCPTSRFDNEIRFFREFLPNNHFLGAYYLGFDWYGWRDLSKMEILIALGIVWPVSSDKWKAPLNSNLELPLTLLSKRDTFGMGTRCPSGIIKKELYYY